jgi:hypothetical protein
MASNREACILVKARGNVRMPYINVQITTGASREQKSQLVSDMTESLFRGLRKHPEHIHKLILL